MEEIKLDNFLTKIGNKLSLKFIDLGIDYLVLEEKTKMSRAKIKRIFCGTQDMRVSELLKICEALSVDLKDLW